MNFELQLFVFQKNLKFIYLQFYYIVLTVFKHKIWLINISLYTHMHTHTHIRHM